MLAGQMRFRIAGRGCSLASGSGCPSFTAPLRRDGSEGLPPPLELTAPRGALHARYIAGRRCRSLADHLEYVRFNLK